ncbi:Ig-like domain repeat protein [Streptomyces sp. NPDC050504]|uniref:Ig-like domain repeat protein n=1 Tax=Streptomyces sp. NPDC050504 TaxID=3365618 RepID=UPI0037B4DB1D
MRTRSTSIATALAVGLSSVVLATGAASQASADSARILSVASVGDLVVDGVHQRVYVSDPSSGKIVVTDYAGTVKATLTGLSGVSGLALSADSSQVYAAVKDARRIVSVETATYTTTASYDLGAAPRELEVVDGRIWFSHDSSFGSLDVSGPQPVVRLSQNGAVTFSGATLLASDPAVPGVLVAGGGSALAVYDVTADGAVLRVKGDMSTSVDQLDLTPDGKRVLTSWGPMGHGYSLGEYSTGDLAAQSGYPIEAYPNAVRVAADGTIAGGSESWYGDDVHIHKPGGRTPVREYDFPNTGTSSGADTLVDGALAWSPDSTRLFAVSVNNHNVHTLRTLTDPVRELPALTVSAPAKAERAKKLTVTGRLTSKTVPAAGTALTVVRTDVERPGGKQLPAVKTAANGTFSFTDTPTAGGKVRYKVTYAGDATRAAATATAAVTVSRKTPAMSLNNNGKLYAYGKDVTFTAHLGATYTNRTVALYADPFGSDKPKKLLKTAKVNAKGNVAAVVDMTRDTTVTAVFTGDARTAPRTVTATALAEAKVTTAVSRHYRTGRIGSTTYYYFRKSTDPLFTTTMNYYGGRKQRFQVQVLYRGTWYDAGDGAEYFALGRNGKSAVSLPAPGEAGIHARMRSSYINGASGDSVNSTTHGAWKYFTFTN